MRRFTEDRVDVGRAEGVALRFDPTADLQVSALHARFERRADGWWLRDLDSRNGTWVDDVPLDSEHRVRPGDRIRFGRSGPEVDVLPADVAPPDDHRARTLERRNRFLLVTLALAVAVGVAGLALADRSREADREAWERERAALAARTDSLLEASREAVARLQGEVVGLGDALEDSRARVEGLQSELAALGTDGSADPLELADLRARLQAATAALERQQIAASLDAPGLTRRVRPAVVQIYAEFDGDRRSAATGFAVSPDGRIVTNRHVVEGPDGTERTRRLGVQFSGSPQVWPAEVLRTDSLSDLALLRIRNLAGDHPVVPGINLRVDSLVAGAPLLLLGFPFATPPEPGAGPPRALSTAGVLLGRFDGRLEIQGWGAEGASGSPVVDADGDVVGVLYGAAGTNDERRLVAVPADDLLRFLDLARGPL